MSAVDLKSKSPPYKFFRASQGAIRHVSFDYSGRYCLTSGCDKSVKLWRPDLETLLFKYSGHSDEVLQSFATRDNSKFISAGKDAKVLLWDVASGKVLRKYYNFIGAVTSIALCHDDSTDGRNEAQMFFAGGSDGKLNGFDLRCVSSQPVILFDEARDAISSLDVGKNSIAFSTASGTLFSFDLANFKAFKDQLTASSEAINCIKLINSGAACLISSNDNRVSLINLKNGSLYADLNLGNINFGGYKIEFDIDANEDKFLCGSSNSEIFEFDMNKRALSKIHKVKEFNVINCVSLCKKREVEEDRLRFIASSEDYLICF
ncbi:MAG: WD repeat-containing protein 83 [Marteilia pararefringens]